MSIFSVDEFIRTLKEFSLVLMDRQAYNILLPVLFTGDPTSVFLLDKFQIDKVHSMGLSRFVSASVVSMSVLPLERLDELCKLCSEMKLDELVIFCPMVTDNKAKQALLPLGQHIWRYKCHRFENATLKLFETHIPFKPTFSDLILVPSAHNSDEFHELTQICHMLNSYLWLLDACDHVYSFGKPSFHMASHFASQFSACAERRRLLQSRKSRTSATVIFLGDLMVCDPIACLEPYVKPSHLMDLLFTELSPDGHSVPVCWDSMCHLKADEPSDRHPSESSLPFTTDLMRTSDYKPTSCLNRYGLLKEQEALKALQNDILNAAQAVGYDLPEFSKAPSTRAQWASLLSQQVKSLFVPVCHSGHLDLLDTVQLAKATSLALSNFSKRVNEASEGRVSSTSPVEKLLTRFERSLLTACQIDFKALSQLEEASKCEPILVHALQEAKNLVHLDDRFLLVAYLINLLPVQYRIPQLVWIMIEELLTTAERTSVKSDTSLPYYCNNLIPTALTASKLIDNLKRLREERRKLPSYNNVWTTQARYRSPVVQLLNDLINARIKPAEASPALKGLEYHPSGSSVTNWLTDLSRYVRISGTSENSVYSYVTDYVILVVTGGFPFALARELLDMSQSEPFKLKIVVNRFVGGRDGLSTLLRIE